MTPDRIHLARHGETVWNREARLQGQLDSPLLSEGSTHAHQLAEFACRHDVDMVFSSPLGRARETAEVCTRALGIELIIIDELAEIHHGAMAGLTADEIHVRFPGQLEQRRKNKYLWPFPEGESYADGDARAETALDAVLSYRPIRPLIVSHEMIGRMLIRNLLDLPPHDALRLKQPHDIVFEVTLAATAPRTLTALSTST